MYSLLLAVQANPTNPTELLNWQGTPFIIGWSLLILFIASRTIQEPNVGPKMPLGPFAPLFNNISVAGFIAAMSFGHILGVLNVFGLSGILQNAQ
jgi:photosystem I subunit X